MDSLQPDHRSENMRRIRSENTKPELVVRRIIHSMGLRFRLHAGDLPGKPDLVLPRWKTVVFVHGCFWHGHTCRRGSATRKPKSHVDYWLEKLAKNCERDRRQARRLRSLGWRRLVVWECETKNLDKLRQKLARLFRPES